MTKQELALQFAQKFDIKPVYTTEEAISIAGSKDKAYRRLQILKSLGVIKYNTYRYFTINVTLVSQPVKIIEMIFPSLESLSKARRFGRHYDDSDVNFAINKKINYKLITLDYKAWELTKFQYPSDLYMYVEDVEKTVCYLREKRFSEGKNGHIVILPMVGDFDNEIQRVYFDCLANGGRSIQDAVAIELLYSDRFSYKATFPIELTQKVQDDLPTNKE